MNVIADLAAIPISTIIVLAIVIVTIVIALLIGIKQIGVTRLGPIEIEHVGQSTNAWVLKQLEDVDISLHDQIWDMTTLMMKQFTDQNLCFFGRRALNEGILNPLQKRAACNHFTTHLTGGHLTSYKAQILENIRDYYEEVVTSAYFNNCNQISKLRTWPEVESFYNELIDRWINRVAIQVKEACEQKVHIYMQALETKDLDKYWSKIFEDCKVKNEQYIKELRSF